MNKKKLITILAAIVLTATLSVSLFFAPFQVNATANTYNADNMTVNGVLASDNYVLYPYETDQNLIFGFSKYGEMINGVAPEVGLKYRGLDVFANPYVLEKDWSQGWFIDIHYADLENHYKNAWAFAMYSDLSGSTGIGGDWKEGCTEGPLGTPYGGRKTNVWATTDPIKVLYDGPRRFVALTKTTLYGASTKTSDDALVSITITFVFNKVKKNVILFKDIKRLDRGKFGRTFQVEFSNRGEWDIGTSAAPPSYAHFYDDLATVYNYEYHNFYGVSYPITGFDMCQMIDQDGSYVGFAAFWPQLFGKLVDGTTHITRSTILGSLCTQVHNETWATLKPTEGTALVFTDVGWLSSDPYPTGLGDSSDEPMVFKNNVLLTGDDVDYTWNGATDTITFTTAPADTDYITVVYKHVVNGGASDMTTEPDTPYVIGEWCFDLKNQDYKRIFRAVSVYGLMDRHNGDDYHATAETWSDGANVIDSEVQYYLDEIFNPYDLYDAVHKQTKRHVNFFSGDGSTTEFVLTDGLEFGTGTPTSYDVPDISTVDNYGSDIWGTYWFLNWQDEVSGIGEIGFSHEQNHTPDKHWSVKYMLDDGTNEAVSVRIVPPQAVSLATAFRNGISYWSYIDQQTGSPYNIPSFCFHLDTDYDGLWDARLHWEPTTTNLDTWELNTLTTTSQVWEHTGGLTQAFGNFIDGKNTDGTVVDANSTIIFVDISAGWAATWDNTIAYIDDVELNGYTYNFEQGRLSPADWEDYCSFAERVLVGGTLQTPQRAWPTAYDYTLAFSGTTTDSFIGDGTTKTFTLTYTNVVPNTEIVYYGETLGVLDVQQQGATKDYTIDYAAGTITFTTAPTDGYYIRVFYQYYPRIVFTTAPSAGTNNIKVLYSTISYENYKPTGQYEWMVVGKNAATIDSLGAAYMTEAFDSRKDIEVQVTGLDINDTAYGPHAPFVMGGAVTGTRADYVDSLGRSYLRDDWCHTYPISSSNMLFSGGPRANLGSEYFNEFTNAFFAEAEYVVNNTGQANKILALTCWNRNTYGAGYAVISVYKDLNGTIGFLIWGYNGEDTYYAAKWFWETGIEYLQTENRGVTDIILHISYTTCPYSVSIANNERLGTISEKAQHDP